MSIGTALVIVVLSYYGLYAFDLIFKQKRLQIVQKNEQLEELRKIPKKTIEEQRLFLDTKFHKRTGKFHLSWSFVWMILWGIIKFSIIATGLFYLFQWMKWEFNLWIGIACVIFIPLLFNLILRFFKLNRPSELDVFMR